MKIGDVAAAFGKGLFAGVAGTAAMTASNTLEMKLRNRGASSAPADAAAKVLGVEPVDEEAQPRFSNLVHWGYGTAWGGARGLVAAAGLSGTRATAVPRSARNASPGGFVLLDCCMGDPRRLPRRETQ